MKQTANYNLKKPDNTDFYNIKDMNDNADIVDAELKKINDELLNKASSIINKIQSFSDFGEVGEFFGSVLNFQIYTIGNRIIGRISLKDVNVDVAEANKAVAAIKIKKQYAPAGYMGGFAGALMPTPWHCDCWRLRGQGAATLKQIYSEIEGCAIAVVPDTDELELHENQQVILRFDYLFAPYENE